jgi:hypothetical protein
MDKTENVLLDILAQQFSAVHLTFRQLEAASVLLTPSERMYPRRVHVHEHVTGAGLCIGSVPPQSHQRVTDQLHPSQPQWRSGGGGVIGGRGVIGGGVVVGGRVAIGGGVIIGVSVGVSPMLHLTHHAYLHCSLVATLNLRGE